MKLRFVVGSAVGVSVMILGTGFLPHPSSLAAVQCGEELGAAVTLTSEDPELWEIEHWGDPGRTEEEACELSNLVGYSEDPGGGSGYCSYEGVFSLPKSCTTWLSWDCPGDLTGIFYYYMQTYAGGAATFYGSFTKECGGRTELK